MKKRLLAILLTACMLMIALSTMAMATDTSASMPAMAMTSSEASAPTSEQPIVAKIGDTPYTSLKAAIDAVPKNGNEPTTIIMQGNVVLTEPVRITDGIKVNLDLNNCTISKTSTPIIVCGGELNVTGTGTITETENDKLAAIMVFGAADENVENYSVVSVGEHVTLGGWAPIFINRTNAEPNASSSENTWGVPNTQNNACGVKIDINGTLVSPAMEAHTAAGHGVYINGQITKTTNCPEINIGSTAKITSKGPGVYAAGYAKWDVSGTIQGASSGIEIRAGELTVNDGAAITATAIPTTVAPNGNGTTSSGAGIAVAQHTTGMPIKVTISGGEINGYSALYESNPQENDDAAIEGVEITVTNGTFTATNGGTQAVYSKDVKDFITGGTFSSDVSNYCVPGLAATDSNSDGKYTIGVAANTVAQVVGTDGTVKNAYATLGEAIAQVESGETIKILCDILNAEGIKVESNKNFTIDFNNKTYTLVGPGAGSTNTETNGFQLLKDSTITFKNGTINISEGASKIKRIIQNYANLTLENMVFNAKNQVGGENLPLSFNNGEITFKGNTSIITTSNDTIAFDVCKFSTYPSTKVSFDEDYTGTINGKILYDSPNADTHTLTINGYGTFGTIATTNETAAKSAISISGGTFSEPVNPDYCADNYVPTVDNEGKYSVAQAADDTSLTVEGITLTAGDTGTLTAKVGDETVVNVTWTSNNENVATIDESGKVTAVAPGTATITATVNEKTATCTVTVNPAPVVTPTYTVTAPADVANGKVTVSPKNAVKNSTVTITATPDEGYELSDLTVTDASGKELELTDLGGGKYSFKMPGSKVTVSATFTKADDEKDPIQDCPQDATCPAVAFADIASGAWYHDGVHYCVAEKLMNGVGDNKFDPNGNLSRAMLVTVLYRLEGSPEAGAPTFTDVPADQWYSAAVAWAAENQIVNGVGDNRYAPNEDISRQDMATILHRYAKFKGYDMTKLDTLAAYSDADSIASYAKEPFQWCVANGIINGMTSSTIVPKGNATRAEVATVLMRYCENIAK